MCRWCGARVFGLRVDLGPRAGAVSGACAGAGVADTTEVVVAIHRQDIAVGGADDLVSGVVAQVDPLARRLADFAFADRVDLGAAGEDLAAVGQDGFDGVAVDGSAVHPGEGVAGCRWGEGWRGCLHGCLHGLVNVGQAYGAGVTTECHTYWFA